MLSGESKADIKDQVQFAHRIQISNKLHCVVANTFSCLQKYTSLSCPTMPSKPKKGAEPAQELALNPEPPKKVHSTSATKGAQTRKLNTARQNRATEKAAANTLGQYIYAFKISSLSWQLTVDSHPAKIQALTHRGE